MAKGRFKGWRSEATIAKMTKEEQEIYRLFVQEVENARKNGMELPEPPHFSTDKPVSTGTGTGKRGRPRKNKTEDTIKNTKVNNPGKVNNPETDDDTDNLNDDAEDATYNKESEVRRIIREQVEYQKSFLGDNDPEGTFGGNNWWDPNDSKGDVCETVIHHLSREDYCIIETNERFWINQIKRMIEKTPDKVIILDNWSNGDTLRVKIPYSAMKRCKVSTRTVSEEQRERMSLMGKAMVEKRRAMRDAEMEEEVEETEQENSNPENSNPETTLENNTKVNNTETIPEIEKVEAEIVSSPHEEETDEETDEEFEGTPMNRFRQVEEETPDIPDDFGGELEDMGPDYGPNMKPIQAEGKSLDDIDYRDLNF